MSFDPRALPPMFHIDVSAESAASEPQAEGDKQDIMVSLLRQIVAGQEKQQELLEELVHHAGAQHKQRVAELGQWKKANPELARRCRTAAETLARVQNEFLEHLTDEIVDHEQNLLDGEFMLNEFVDRFGPRLAHLNGVIQVLAQLSVQSESPKAAKR
ncbi:MAG: hypothetical protein EA424_08115 [Planctomycetaceae bacterium]|nr:MAG: hypothetical protein EA424_08115 [Planctomycetaceae bacterium]